MIQNKKTCHTISAMNMLLNMFPDIEWNKDEFENYIFNEYPSPMPKGGAPWVGWARRVAWYANDKYGKKIAVRIIKPFWKIFDSWLANGKHIAVNININDEITRAVFNQYLPAQEYKRPYTGWHWLLLGLDEWGYYFLNSIYPKTNKVRLQSLDMPWLFKSWEWYSFIQK